MSGTADIWAKVLEVYEMQKRMEGKVDAILARFPKPMLPRIDVRDPKHDYVVRKDPKRWAGPSCVGLPYSKCPSDFLMMVGDFLVWLADQKDSEGKQRFAAMDRTQAAAAYAHADANRIKEKAAGQDAPPETPAENPQDDDELPF